MAKVLNDYEVFDLLIDGDGKAYEEYSRYDYIVEEDGGLYNARSVDGTCGEYGCTRKEVIAFFRELADIEDEEA